ncbi:MAG TPA: hypothetical protein VMD92_07065 [Acidobacteriaceae bacterium]|nr:hypothetical protein [Acidobacteriaceae bacterium]
MVTFTPAISSTRSTAPINRQQGCPHFARDVRLQRIDDQPAPQVRPPRTRVLRNRICGDRLQLVHGSLDAHARPHAAHQIQVISPFGALEICRQRLRVVVERRPDVRLRRQHVLKLVRHHADHRVAIAIERDGAAYDPAIAAEFSLPKPVAHDRDLRPVISVFGGKKVAAQPGRHTQHAQKARAHAFPVQPLGLCPAHQYRLPGLVGSQRLE